MRAGDDPWKPLEFLIGEWTAGQSAGQPGQASAGGFTFSFDLDRKILVRKNFAEYPAANGRPAFRHEDLMVVYAGDPLKATYWDNEGHVIQYKVNAVAGGVQFVSDPSDKEPRYRLTYKKTGDRTADLSFDIAPPGQADAFKPYVSASIVKK
jgi:hypothetical protein